MLRALFQIDPLATAPLTERKLRQMTSVLRWTAALGLVAMALFHLYGGTFGARTAMVQRSTHLAFGAGLAFLLFPMFKPGRWPRLLYLDLVLAALAVGTAAYVGLLHEQLARRAGAETNLDLIVAAVGIVLLLEATRRSVSPALTLVTIGFILFALLGHHLPGDFGHAQLNLRRLLRDEYYTTDGVFGIPLHVSSTFVFLFVLFGACLEKGGAGRYMIDLAFSTMGRFRGGPAKAAVMASGLMGTISGSSIANTVSTGSMTIPLMKKAGFRPHVAAAVEVAASTNGQLMPPVMGAAAFIMAEFTGIPYSTIIIAAALPAVLSYTAIFTMIHLEAMKHGLQPADPDSIPRLRRTMLRGVHFNLPLIAVLWCLLGAGMTPGLSATIAIWTMIGLSLLAALFLRPGSYGLEELTSGSFAKRGKHFAVRTLGALRDGAMNMVGIACACACCGIIIGVVGLTGMAGKITGMIESMSGGSILPALILTMLVCLVMGIGLPTTATYIIMATLAVPPILNIAEPDLASRSMTLILAAHLFVFYYGIMADDTPPVGLCAYAAAGIAGSDPIRTGLTSFRFDLAAFTLPLIFFLNPELLLQDRQLLKLLWLIPAAVLGMMCFAAALQGFVWDRVRWWERLLLLCVSFLMVTPSALHSLLGVGLLAVMFVAHRAMATAPGD